MQQRDINDDSLVYYDAQSKNPRRTTVVRTLQGLLIVVGIAGTWVGSTQFIKSTYTKKFNAPWFVMWFKTSWMSLSYPVVSICFRFVTGCSFKNIFDKAQTVFGDRGVCPTTLLTRCLPFVILWCACNYMYVRALSVLSATDVTALFSSAPVFVYLLSLILLRDDIFKWRCLFATAISVAGIVVIAYSNGFSGPSAVGIILAVGAAVLAAVYKVSFKVSIGDAKIHQVSLFLTCLGLINLLGLWPIMEIMHFTRYEHIEWNAVPWPYLCACAVLSVMFNFLINFGIAFTFPLFISLGTVLGIPLNAVVDTIARGVEFTFLKGLGAAFIVLGFILMTFRSKQRQLDDDESEEPMMSSALNNPSTQENMKLTI